jgi:hypothetical protein
MNVVIRRTLQVAGAAVVGLLLPATAAAQAAPPCPEPAALPPAGSSVLVRCVQIIAHPVNETLIPQQTYALQIRMPQTLPSQGVWAPYDESAVQADFWSLWRTGFLDNLWVEVLDEPFLNGVMAKHIVFHIEERSKVKDVNYLSATEGQKRKVPVADIEDTMRGRGVSVRG